MRTPLKRFKGKDLKAQIAKRKVLLPEARQAKIRPYLERKTLPDATAIDKAIHCKLCNTVIAKYVQDEGTLGSFKTKNNTVVTRVPMVWAYLSNYYEVKIQFDNGSFHITSVCKGCFDLGLSVEDLEILYLADLDQLAEEGSDLDEVWFQRFPFKVVDHGNKGLV